jgi:solute carrier family 35 (UDP-galactose transporter), member B1
MYTGYSIVQEELATTLFGGQRFTQMQSLLLLQCAFNCVVALMCVYVWDTDGRHLKKLFQRRQLVEQSVIGLTYCVAMLLSNMALTYVRYHEQVLAKSSKPIFVLVVARLANARVFPLWKYAVVLSITLGGVLFMSSSSSSSSSPSTDDGAATPTILPLQDPNHLWWGRLLVLASLILDGVTALQQDSLAQSYVTHTDESESSRPSAFKLMLYVNFWASLYLTLSSVVTGELFDCIRLVAAHSDLAFLVCAFATCSCLGQLFIFSTIRHHGALLCSMVTTTRKFSTVLLSVVLFGHPMTAVQFVGIFLLFGALFVDIYLDHGGGVKRIC